MTPMTDGLKKHMSNRGKAFTSYLKLCFLEAGQAYMLNTCVSVMLGFVLL